MPKKEVSYRQFYSYKGTKRERTSGQCKLSTFYYKLQIRCYFYVDEYQPDFLTSSFPLGGYSMISMGLSNLATLLSLQHF